MGHKSNTRRTRAARMLGSTSVFALVLAGGLLLAPNTASAGPFDDLCTAGVVTTDTVLNGVTDSVTGDCTITVANRVNFSIIDSTLDVTGSLTINGEGRAQPPKAAQLLIEGTTLDVGTISGHFDINFEAGNIRIVNGNIINLNLGNMTVDAEGGDIVIDNDNDISVDGIIRITNAEGGDVIIEDNPVTIDARRIEIDVSDKSNVSIKNNGFITFGEI